MALETRGSFGTVVGDRAGYLAAAAEPATPPVVKESPARVIARNLVIARDLVGFTQHELAAKSGVSRATVAQLESGGGDPRLSTIVDVAAALGISPLVLLAGRREVTALTALGRDLAERPVAIGDQDLARMREFAGSVIQRDWGRAARIGASVGRAGGCKSPGSAATAGLFSVVAPGRGTAVGTALGRLLE
ncbi:MAG TPA: helix-turn-helix domain-containing protein [Humisphaera sp.]